MKELFFLLLLSLGQLLLALRRAPFSKTSYISSTLRATAADYTGYALLFDCDGVIVETEVVETIEAV
jgi:hypothetical protein